MCIKNGAMVEIWRHFWFHFFQSYERTSCTSNKRCSGEEVWGFDGMAVASTAFVCIYAPLTTCLALELSSEMTIRAGRHWVEAFSNSPSFKGVIMRPNSSPLAGNAESDNTIWPGRFMSSRRFFSWMEISPPFQEPITLCFPHATQSSMQKQKHPVINVACNLPLNIVFCKSALLGFFTR